MKIHTKQEITFIFGQRLKDCNFITEDISPKKMNLLLEQMEQNVCFVFPEGIFRMLYLLLQKQILNQA